MLKKLLFGIALAGVCLYFAFQGISIRATMDSLRQAQCQWIALAVVLYGFAYVMRTWRWKILMGPVHPVPASQLFHPLVIGFFANNVLPFRMGELVRAHVTGRKFGISRTASLGTILLERLSDMISFLSTFVAAAFFFPFPRNAERGAALMAAACVALIFGLIVGIKFRSHLHQWIDKLPLPAPWKARLQDITEDFVQGISGVHNLSYVAGAMALSLIIWINEGTNLFLIARAFPIHLSYPQAFFLLFFLGLSVTLPQAPGYVGTMELFGVTALTLLGITKAQALPVILAIHGTQFSFIIVLGLFSLWREGMSFNKLVEPAKQELAPS